MEEMQRTRLESAGMEIDRTVERFSGNEGIYVKFLKKFPDDENLTQLSQAVAAGDDETALRAAHTLKGLCANLGMKTLYELCSEMVRLYREQQPDEAAAQLPALRAAHERVCGAIAECF